MIMSRQLEQGLEEKRRKRNKAIVAAVEYSLIEAVARSGAILEGFSVKLGPMGTLLTLRVQLAGRRQVAFVGGEDLGSCLIKAARLAGLDKLDYRASKF
jgi:hypothetical protein